MNRQRALLALIVLCAIWALVLYGQTGPGARHSAPRVPPEREGKAAPVAKGPVVEEEAPAAATPPRVRIPRPTAPRRIAAPPEVPTAAQAPVAAGPVDRRPDAPADAGAVKELLMQQMDDVSAEIGPCVDRWAKADTRLNGSVKLRFAMDADGLQDVWIEEHSAVPDGLLGCFSDAVYGADWAGISREPLEVSWPFQVTAEP